MCKGFDVIIYTPTNSVYAIQSSRIPYPETCITIKHITCNCNNISFSAHKAAVSFSNCVKTNVKAFRHVYGMVKKD